MRIIFAAAGPLDNFKNKTGRMRGKGSQFNQNKGRVFNCKLGILFCLLLHFLSPNSHCINHSRCISLCIIYSHSIRFTLSLHLSKDTFTVCSWSHSSVCSRECVTLFYPPTRGHKQVKESANNLCKRQYFSSSFFCLLLLVHLSFRLHSLE